jgi:hypothetical protein
MVSRSRISLSANPRIIVETVWAPVLPPVPANHEYALNAVIVQTLSQDALPNHSCSPEEDHFHDRSLNCLSSE